mmetsp:Transcript_16839/g.54385  ORF Transcript_16839/g.54385 Transcript_16839/m.54385 type:complete len:293 (-) Transcript_16839:102-980(-)
MGFYCQGRMNLHEPSPARGVHDKVREELEANSPASMMHGVLLATDRATHAENEQRDHNLDCLPHFFRIQTVLLLDDAEPLVQRATVRGIKLGTTRVVRAGCSRALVGAGFYLGDVVRDVHQSLEEVFLGGRRVIPLQIAASEEAVLAHVQAQRIEGHRRAVHADVGLDPHRWEDALELVQHRIQDVALNHSSRLSSPSPQPLSTTPAAQVDRVSVAAHPGCPEPATFAVSPIPCLARPDAGNLLLATCRPARVLRGRGLRGGSTAEAQALHILQRREDALCRDRASAAHGCA